ERLDRGEVVVARLNGEVIARGWGQATLANPVGDGRGGQVRDEPEPAPLHDGFRTAIRTLGMAGGVALVLQRLAEVLQVFGQGPQGVVGLGADHAGGLLLALLDPVGEHGLRDFLVAGQSDSLRGWVTRHSLRVPLAGAFLLLLRALGPFRNALA